MKLKFQKLFLFDVFIMVISFSRFNTASESFCATKLDETPIPLPRSKNGSQIEYFGDLSIKLNIYYDYYLFVLHKLNRTSIETFINRTISSISLTYRQPEIQRVARISFWVKNIRLFNESGLDTHKIDKYLQDFNRKLNLRDDDPKDVIYSLFTGYDLISDSASKATQGLAPKGSLCKRKSCFIVEAKFYKAAIVSAHEMGHILGMNHDELDELTIMHNYTGRGKTKWSDKSVDEMKIFFNNLKDENKWCLKQSTDTNVDIISTDIDEQCRQMFGPEFQVYHQLRTLYNSICQLFWCRSGPFILKGHMALENTECDGPNSYCSAGQCHKRVVGIN